MPQLEPLNLKLTGSADGLSVALGKAQKDTSGFGAHLNKIGDSISGALSKIDPKIFAIGTALAGVGAAAAAAYTAISRTSAAMQSVDELADAANRLGISVNELKGVRLSLGEATGLDSSSIDAAIMKLQINLAEAAQTGSGKAFEALQQLGLSAGDLLAAGPQRAFEMLAEKISQISDRGRQLQTIFDIGGKAGAALAAALTESPEKLKEAYQWAQKFLGLTEQQVAAIGNANDAWDRLKALVDTAFQVLAAEAAPAVEGISKEISAIVESLGGVQPIVREIVNWVAKWAGYMVDIAELVTMGDRTFDTGNRFVAALERQRNAPQDERRRAPTEAELSALEAKSALEATGAAAKAVAATAEKTAAKVEQIKPPSPLAAVTDRAEQIRRVAELQAAKQNAQGQAALLAEAKQQTDSLRKIERALTDEPKEQVIDLD